MSNRLPFSGSAGFSRLLPRYGMALLVLLCAGSLRAGEVEVIKDVVYGKGGGEDLLLDLVKPKDNGGAPRPGIVFLHGGGWKGGDKNAGIWILETLARRGYVGVTINYRLTGKAKWPAQIEDCKCAVRFLRAKAAEYNIDPDHIGTWGGSAGGHLAAMLGLTSGMKEFEGKGGWEGQSSSVQAVLAESGVFDLYAWKKKDPKGVWGMIRDLVGGDTEEFKDAMNKASPITYVSKTAPPFLVVSGDKDAIHFLSVDFSTALKAAGGTVEFVTVKDGEHGGVGWDVTFNRTKAGGDFFDTHLRPVATKAPAGTRTSAPTEDRLANIFQNNMVLQREKPVPVWGWAAAGTQVEVAFAGQKKKAVADDRGYWKAVLDPLVASREGRALEVRIGSTTITRSNILVGEVWLAAGQSNMVTKGPDKDTGVYPHHISPGTKGGKPEIRLCDGRLGFGASLEPLPDLDLVEAGVVPWEQMKEDPPPDLLTPAHSFARVLRDALDVPVGVVIVAAAGSNQASWMARETLEAFPGAGKAANYYQEWLAETAERQAKRAANGGLATWDAFKQAEARWKEARKVKWVEWPGIGTHFVDFPSVNYNNRIHPLAPFALRGAIWHQGESGPGGPYGDRLAAMVRQWRTLFGQELHFIWGTLARDTQLPPPLNPLRTYESCSGANWVIRDQAIKAFGKDPLVACVEMFDLGNGTTHWNQKAEAGRRLALAALTVSYGQKHLYTGPRMVESKITGGTATLRFDLVGDNQLVHQPSINGISGVILRSKAGLTRWGEVKVVGKDTIEVSHPDLADIETVAYAESPNPHETLFNSAGLPASPCRVNPVTNPSFIANVECRAPPQLLSLEDPKARVEMQVAHVRRGGYVFLVRLPWDGKPKPATIPNATMLAYIPAEWKGFEVEANGKPLAVTETTTGGARFAKFDAPVDGTTWIIVAETGKAAGFRTVKRY